MGRINRAEVVLKALRPMSLVACAKLVLRKMVFPNQGGAKAKVKAPAKTFTSGLSAKK